MNPLDKFRFERKSNGEVTLNFNDLAVDGNSAEAETSKYIYTLSHPKKGINDKAVTVDALVIPISQNGEGFLDDTLAHLGEISDESDKIFRVKIETQWGEKLISKAVEVYFYYPGNSGEPRVVGIVREE
jgi:hypothetical protein